MAGRRLSGLAVHRKNQGQVRVAGSRNPSLIRVVGQGDSQCQGGRFTNESFCPFSWFSFWVQKMVTRLVRKVQKLGATVVMVDW